MAVADLQLVQLPIPGAEIPKVGPPAEFGGGGEVSFELAENLDVRHFELDFLLWGVVFLQELKKLLNHFFLRSSFARGSYSSLPETCL